jgi:hypothetical protein
LSTNIFYNNVDPLVGLGVVSSIEKDDEMFQPHDRWSTKSTLTVRGLLTGNCSNDITTLFSRQRQLINAFSEDHKNFEIREQGQVIYLGPYTIVRSVNFPSNQYVRNLPFEITLETYQTNLFSGVFGVETPSHTIEYSQNEDNTIQVTRTIGAKGFTTTSANASSNALQNAKTWVQARTGFSNIEPMGTPHFITIALGCVPCLQEFSENINRMEGSYEVTETYQFRDSCVNSNILRYSTDIDYNDQEGIYNVSVDGDFDACTELTITGMRSMFADINVYDLANESLHGTFPTAPNLNPEWLSKSIEEDTNKKNVTFRYNFDTDFIPKVMFEKEFSVDIDTIEDKITVNMQGVIKARGSQKERWERAFSYYNTSLNIFNLITTFYASRGYTQILNPNPLSNQTTFDKFAGEISISVTYDNRPLPPNGFKEWDYTITVEPPINIYSYIPNLCQDYIVMDIRAARRAVATIDGDALAVNTSDLSNSIRANAASILLQYVAGTNQILRTDNIDKATEGQDFRYSFNRSIAFNGSIFTL